MDENNSNTIKSENPIIQKYLDVLDWGKLDIREISPNIFNVYSEGLLVFSVSSGFLVTGGNDVYDGKSFKDIDKLARKCQTMVQNRDPKEISEKIKDKTFRQDSTADKLAQKIHKICSPGHHDVKNMTMQEFEDENFQKWWARHPWRMIRVDNGRVVMHPNMLNVYSAMLVVIGLGLCIGFVDAVKWQGYKHQKSQLTEKQIQDKYSKCQVIRYDAYTKLQQKLK